MASYSLSLTRGQTEFQIVEGTNAPGAGDIELRINLVPFVQNAVDGSTLPRNAEIQTLVEMFQNFLAGRSKTIV